MNLMATQLGAKKKVASSAAKITAPAMESFEYGTGSYELKHAPKGEVKEIYVLNGDSTFGKKYTKGTAPSETEFSLAGQTMKLPTGLNASDELFVMYDYETENAVEVVNSATEFPVGCKFVMEVLGCDVCDQTTLVHAYVIFNNFKLSPDFDWSNKIFATNFKAPCVHKERRAA